MFKIKKILCNVNNILFKNVGIGEIEEKKIWKGLVVFVIFVYVMFFYLLFLKTKLEFSQWTISDWLINYEDGGFKRRGLCGSVLFAIQDTMGISLKNQIFFIQIISYTVFLWIIYKNLQKKKLDLFLLCILLSPFVLLYPICTIANAGRKEILLILIFYGYAFLDNKKVYDWIVLIFYLGIIFMHELSFFYLPFLLWIKYKKSNNSYDLFYSATVILLSFISVIVIFNYGGNINQGQSISLLLERGVRLSPGNIFLHEFSFDFSHVIRYKLSFFVHILELVLIVSQMLYYVYYFQRKYFREFLFGFAITIIWTLPLYYLAIDWFRWIHIYSTFLFLIILFQAPKTEIFKINTKGIKVWHLLITPALFLLFYFHMNHSEILINLGF